MQFNNQTKHNQEMVLTEVKKKIQLVDGVFNPSEANDVVNALIGEKINHHKLQCLSMRIENDLAETGYHEARIEELEKEKETLKKYIADARAKGYQVRIDGMLKFSFI